MKVYRNRWVICAFVMLGVISGFAATIASETFDYGNGSSLAGKAAGTGFSGAWTGTLLVNGGLVEHDGNFNVNSTERPLANPISGVTTFYYGIDMGINATGNQMAQVLFTDAGYGGARYFDTRIQWLDYSFNNTGGANGGVNSNYYSAGSLDRVITKVEVFDAGGGDLQANVTIWQNPAGESDTDAIVLPTYTTDMPDDYSIQGIELGTYNTTGELVQWDNFALATTFEEARVISGPVIDPTDIIASETFSYTNGASISGQSGGTGFSGAWTGSVQINDGIAEHKWNYNVNGTERPLANSISGVTTFYYGIDMGIDATGNPLASISFSDSGYGGTRYFDTRIQWLDYSFNNANGANGGVNSNYYSQGSLSRIITKVDVFDAGGGDLQANVTIWTDTTSESDTGSIVLPTYTTDMPDDYSIQGIELGTYNTTGELVQWDNFVLAKTFDAAAAIPSEPSPYESWASGYGLSDTSGSADPDGDGLDNLAEYALGGDPSDAADTGYGSAPVLMAADGTNWLEYVHFERTDKESLGLTYTPQQIAALSQTNWTSSGFVAVGSGVYDDEFNVVTNRIETDTQDSCFVRLYIEKQ